MSVGGKPGEVYKEICVTVGEATASFVGDVSISIAGPTEKIEYFKVGQDYVFHVSPVHGPDPDGGDKAASAS